MRKLISFIMCACLFTCAFAQEEFSKDGIYYRINPNQKDVTVISCPKGSTYDGAIVIPAKVSNEDVTYNVTHIGEKAFFQSSISSVSMPEGLIEIEEAAFRECQNLKSVVIPSTVVNINREAFIFCFALEKLTFKAKEHPTIGSYAFGRTLIKMQGINTGIPANMAVPNKDQRLKVNKSRGYVIY